MKVLKKILWALLVVFVIAQFFGPEKNEGDIASVEPFLTETNPPEEVKVILKETCFDCHSNFTRYPWYNNITPVNYWMADHVRHGKGDLNFSEWDTYKMKRKDHKMEEIMELVNDKEMPLNSYTWTHSEAQLTDEQIQAVVAWTKAVRDAYANKQ